MAWKKVGKEKIVRITHKLAEEWRDMLAVPNDRTLNDRRLKVYRGAIGRGEWRLTPWAKAFCVETGLTYCANGKHTATIFASLDNLAELELNASIEEYTCDTLVDLAALYAIFDTREQSRSVKDINRAYAGSVQELKNINEQILSSIVAGVSYGENFDRYHYISPADRAENILSHVEFAVWANSLIRESKDAKRKLCRVPVIAAMFNTWQKDSARSDVFWCAVVTEDGSLSSLPHRQIAKWLFSKTMRAVCKQSKLYRVESREFYSMCIHAWNAWRENNETPRLRYVLEDPLPEVK